MSFAISVYLDFRLACDLAWCASWLCTCLRSLPPCIMRRCAVRHSGLHARAVRIRTTGTSRPSRRYKGVKPQLHGQEFLQLPPASATAPLYWPLTRHTGTAVDRSMHSPPNCAHLAHPLHTAMAC